MAQVGVKPTNGFVVPDGNWLLGLAGGQNQITQSGISAAGTTQAGSTPLPGGVSGIEVDTCGANAGVSLPFAFAGTELSIFNFNTGQTLTVYPSIANNPNTAAQDTINHTTTTTIATNTSKIFWCSKDGNWAAQ